MARAQRLCVGIISKVHGIRGEAKVFPTTDDIKRFDRLESVYILHRGAHEKHKIQSVKYFKNLVILKFDGIDTPEHIRQYMRDELWIDRQDAQPLGEDEYFISDLIGSDIINESLETIGTADDILLTGANPVLVVKRDDGKTLLLPYIDECILDVNVDDGVIKVHVMDGLDFE